MALDRSHPRRPRPRRGRTPRERPGLLPGRRRRRRLEDGGRRGQLAQRLRRLLRHGLRRGRRGEPFPPRDRLRRHGRGGRPRQRLPRRRRLPLRRRRRDVAAPWTRRDPADRPCAGASGEPRHRLGGRARRCVGRERGAGRLPHIRRGHDVGEGAVPGRELGRDRPHPRSLEPRHPLRLAPGVEALPVGLPQRGPRHGALQEHGRRRHLDRTDGQPGPPIRPQGTDRDHRLAREHRPPVGYHRRGARREGNLPLRRRRSVVDPLERGRQPPPASVVLPPHRRRPRRRTHGLRPQRLPLEVDGRRRDLRARVHAASGPPRPVDRPRESPADGQRGRRRRRGELRRGALVVEPSEPGDGADVPRDGRQPDAVPALRLPAGQHIDLRPQPLRLRPDLDRGLVYGRAGARTDTSR